MTGQVASKPELLELVAGLADNKYFLGRRYAEWCTAAPTLESAVAAAAMAQDEIGHARSLYPLLRDLAGESSEVEPETRTAFTNATFLDEPFAGWSDFVAANFLFDTSMTILLESAETSSMHDLAQRATRIVEEERLHWLHGEGWTRRLPAKGSAVREVLAASFARVAPFSLQWFDLAHPALVEDRTLDVGAEALRDRFCARVNPVLSASGLPTLYYRRQPPAPSCPFCGSLDTELFSLFGQQLLTVQYYCNACRTPFERVKGDDVVEDAARRVVKDDKEA